jgi:hypothetical protein
MNHIVGVSIKWKNLQHTKGKNLVILFFFWRDLVFYFRKFSLEQRDLDDADEDGNTIYRGLAVPVDIRQVVEVII